MSIFDNVCRYIENMGFFQEKIYTNMYNKSLFPIIEILLILVILELI